PDAQLRDQRAHPPAQQTSLDQNHRRLMPGEEPRQLRSTGGDRRELIVVRRAIKASNALVLAQVEGQNGLGGGPDFGRGRRHRASSVGRWYWGLCGNCLRYHTPRLAWILSF